VQTVLRNFRVFEIEEIIRLVAEQLCNVCHNPISFQLLWSGEPAFWNPRLPTSVKTIATPGPPHHNRFSDFPLRSRNAGRRMDKKHNFFREVLFLFFPAGRRTA
jgi:hypothetical protein